MRGTHWQFSRLSSGWCRLRKHRDHLLSLLSLRILSPCGPVPLPLSPTSHLTQTEGSQSDGELHMSLELQAEGELQAEAEGELGQIALVAW